MKVFFCTKKFVMRTNKAKLKGFRSSTLHISIIYENLFTSKNDTF